MRLRSVMRLGACSLGLALAACATSPTREAEAGPPAIVAEAPVPSAETSGADALGADASAGSAGTAAAADAGAPEQAVRAAIDALEYASLKLPAPPTKGVTSFTLRESSLRFSRGLPPEVVRRIVRQNYGRMRECYRREQQDDPTLLAAEYVIRLAIGADGETRLVEITKAPGRRDMDACVLRAFEGLSYPAPDGVPLVGIEYGLTFTGKIAPPKGMGGLR